MHERDQSAYDLFLETLFPGSVSPTRLQIISKNLSRVLLNHNPGDRSRGSGGTSSDYGVFGAVRILNFDGGVFGLELGVAGSGGRVAEPGGGEGAHGGVVVVVVVVVVLVVVDDGVLGFGVGVGVGAAGGDALEVVVGGEGTVAGVGGEGGGGEGRRVVLGHELALVDGRGGGGGGGVRGRGGLGTAGTEWSSAVELHFFRVLFFRRESESNLRLSYSSDRACLHFAVPTRWSFVRRWFCKTFVDLGQDE